MNYNTQRENLPMPEYGRSVQEMIEHAMTLGDRQQRQRCAETIISIMGSMFPTLRDVPDFQGKLWDHLAYMSGYGLDIDYPVEITRLDTEKQKPEPVSYSKGGIRFRHYGRIVPALIAEACRMPEGPDRQQMVRLIAVQMKKDLLAWNKELADDGRVAQDIRLLSDGKIELSEDGLNLQVIQNPSPSQRQFQQRGRRNNKRRY